VSLGLGMVSFWVLEFDKPDPVEEPEEVPNFASPEKEFEYKQEEDKFSPSNDVSNDVSDDYVAEDERNEDEIDDVPESLTPKISQYTTPSFEIIGDHKDKGVLGNDQPQQEELFDTKLGESEISNLESKKLSVKVWNSLIVKEGFFSFSYPTYKVELEPIGWKVRRKESDFVFLREYLRKIYPQMFVPPLILTNDKLSEASLKKKEKYFTRFLCDILLNK
jgi:hypothetical protein